MANGIIYWKLKSEYEGDITKGCSLTGVEGDQNLNVLEGRDIKSVEILDNIINITLYNGEILTGPALIESGITDLDFDAQTGVLTYSKDGKTYGIDGFAVQNGALKEVSRDETLKGNGTSRYPLGVSEMIKTGVFKPVKKIINLEANETLPKPKHCKIGDRYLTHEVISDFGLLYDYDGVRLIECDLKSSDSKWRIPTKDDWDDMLNAIEPCPEDRNHGSHEDNRNLGHWAGKLLKSTNFWETSKKKKYQDDIDDDSDYDYDDDVTDDTSDEDLEPTCLSTYCGEYENHKHKHIDSGGVDKYGFRATPTGYADDGENYLYFKERTMFWAAKHTQSKASWTKRFEYNRSSVHQEVVAVENHLSLRLIREYDGDNFFGTEHILDASYPCTLLPSLKHGSMIWTAANFASNNNKYHGLVPNEGIGVSAHSHYFINEWTGHGWLRNELQEGESVVVLYSQDGEGNTVKDEEYRVVEGELISVTNLLKTEVTEKIETEITEIKEALELEIEERKTADEKLAKEIEAIQKVDETIDSTIQDLTKDVTSLQGDIKDIFVAATKNDTISFDRTTGVLTTTTLDKSQTLYTQLSFDFGEF